LDGWRGGGAVQLPPLPLQENQRARGSNCEPLRRFSLPEIIVPATQESRRIPPTRPEEGVRDYAAAHPPTRPSQPQIPAPPASLLLRLRNEAACRHRGSGHPCNRGMAPPPTSPGGSFRHDQAPSPAGPWSPVSRCLHPSRFRAVRPPPEALPPPHHRAATDPPPGIRPLSRRDSPLTSATPPHTPNTRRITSRGPPCSGLVPRSKECPDCLTIYRFDNDL
jgi:hypothetical protein